MIYAHANEGNYSAWCMYGDIVVLNIGNNKYNIIRSVPHILYSRLFSGFSDSDIEVCQLASALTAIDAISLKVFPGDRIPNPVSCLYTGYVDPDWRLPLSTPHNTSFFELLYCATKILSAGLGIRLRGFDSVTTYLNRRRAIGTASASVAPSIDRFIDLVNQAFIFDVSGNKCLTYSTVLCEFLRNYRYNAKLIVGVRTRPFMRHAWVEVENKIVNDDPHLRDKLSIILEV